MLNACNQDSQKQNVLTTAEALLRNENIHSYDKAGFINISAYLALQASSTDEKSLESTINKLNIADAIKNFLLENLDEWIEASILLQNHLTDSELRDLVLSTTESLQANRLKGESSSPDSICRLATRLLDITANDRVADLGCGNGAFMTYAALNTPVQHFYGVDVNKLSVVLSTLKADVMGSNATIELGDMLEITSLRSFDKVFSQYPFGMRPSHMHGNGQYYEMIRSGKEGIGRPASSDWIFNKLAFDSLTENGKAVVVMTNGATFNGGDEQARKYFVDNNMIEAIIALPARLFSGASISTTLMVLSKNQDSIRMVDATDLFIDGRRVNTMDNDQVEEIVTRLSSDCKNSRLVTASEIASTDYNLFPPRYLGRDIELVNATPLGKLALSIERAAALTAQKLDALTVNEDTGLNYLRLADINDGDISDNLPNLRELNPKMQKQKLQSGDLIISKSGAPFKVAVVDVPEGRTLIANGNLYIVRLDTSIVDPYFVAAFLMSNDGKELMDRLVVGTAIPSLPLGNLQKLEIPVPNSEIQENIAQLYRVRIDEIKVLKARLKKTCIGLTTAYDEVEKHCSL